MSAKTAAKKHKTYLSDHKRRELAGRFHAGEDQHELATEYDVSVSTVRSVAREYPPPAEDPDAREKALLEFGAAIGQARALGGPLGMQVTVTRVLTPPPTTK